MIQCDWCTQHLHEGIGWVLDCDHMESPLRYMKTNEKKASRFQTFRVSLSNVVWLTSYYFKKIYGQTTWIKPADVWCKHLRCDLLFPTCTSSSSHARHSRVDRKVIIMFLALMNKMMSLPWRWHNPDLSGFTLELERDGFCANPFFECLVAEVPEEHRSKEGEVSTEAFFLWDSLLSGSFKPVGVLYKPALVVHWFLFTADVERRVK